MNTIVFLLAIITMGAYLVAIVVIGRAGFILTYQVSRSIMSRVFEFGCIIFTAHGIVISLFFLLSFMPSNNLIGKECVGAIDCQIISLLTGLQDNRWGYAGVATVAFALGVVFYSLRKSRFATEG